MKRKKTDERTISYPYFSMTKAGRNRWLDSMCTSAAFALKHKYQAGAREHGSDLGDLSLSRLLDQLENEALDQLAYVAELKRRML